MNKEEVQRPDILRKKDGIMIQPILATFDNKINERRVRWKCMSKSGMSPVSFEKQSNGGKGCRRK